MEIAKYIDHTLLKPDATKDQIDQLCEEAKKYRFKSVFVNPSWISYVAEQLKDTDVLVGTAVGFPLGATTSETKAFETANAIHNGAKEIDMVLNIGQLKSGNEQFVLQDIEAVVNASGGQALIKVILETSLLSKAEIRRACQLAVKAGADFVKTSTGFSSGGATVEDVKLMRETVGPKFGVKASGGIRTAADAKAMIEAGANRIGSSSGVKIVEEWE